MKLGYAVKTLGRGGLPSHDARRWQSGPHLRTSLGHLEALFGYLEAVGIGMYRMSPALAPYATHPDLPQFRGQVEECAETLEALGSRSREQGLRLSCHPSQYIVLNSTDSRVRDAALADLELQGELFEAMGLGPEAVVVIHVGSAAGDDPVGRFEDGFARLSERARARLVVENDDRAFGLGDVLEVHRRTGIPVVWDVHHHHCHDPEGIADREALQAALATWPAGVRPKIHFSSPTTQAGERRRRSGRRVARSLTFPDPRVHADLIDPFAFEAFLRDTAADLEFDVMLEAKAKDLALLRLRDQMAARGIRLEGP